MGFVPTFYLSGAWFFAGVASERRPSPPKEFVFAVSKASIIADVERTLAENLPEVEVVDVEVGGSGGNRGNRILRVFIDHPDGVSHSLCARVTGLLAGYLRDNRVEVSSPGLERRLRKPEHFQAAAGKKINVRTFGPVQGQRNFTGFLVSSDDQFLKMNLDGSGQEVSIPLSEVSRARTVFEFGNQVLPGSGKRKKKGR